MFLTKKKSLIKNWWVTHENDKMSFVNILKKENITRDLIVVGIWEHDLATSTNNVVKVTNRGVITEKGTFYPFTEANEVYLQYLIDVNNGNPVIALNWKKLGPNKIVADIIINKKLIKNCTLDFKPYTNSIGVTVSGHSKLLTSVVVLNPFKEGKYCMKLEVPINIMEKIKKGSMYLDMEKIGQIEAILKKNAFFKKYKKK